MGEAQVITRVGMLKLIASMALILGSFMSPVAGLNAAEQDMSSLLPSFYAALNGHNVGAVLSLFTDDAVVDDPFFIVCPFVSFSWPMCGSMLLGMRESYSSPTKYIGKIQIRSWFDWLVRQNIAIKQIGDYHANAENLRLTLAFSLDYYRSLLDPIVVNAQAIVHEGKLRLLLVEPNAESHNRILAAGVAARQVSRSINAGGLVVGFLTLILLIPVGVVVVALRRKRVVL